MRFLPNTHTQKLHRQKGVTLIEMIAALAIMAIAFAGFYQILDQQSKNTRVATGAQQIKTTAEAMQAYINDNQATILANATLAKPYFINIASLRSGNYLPANNSSKTSWGHNMCGLVLNNSGKLFGVLAFEGGTALDDVTLSNLASQIGAAGGGVYTNPTIGSGVRGTQGGWSLALPTNFANANTAGTKCDGKSGAVTLTAGRPVVALWQGIGLNNQDLLYRKSVNGQPQLNQMQAPLGLWVDSAGTTVVQSAACTTSGAMAADSTGKPYICQNGTWNAVNSSTTAYWKAPVANFASLPASGNSVGDGRITTDTYRGYSWNGSSWVALAVDQNGNLTMSGNLTANTLIPTATVTQGTACSPNGAIAKDSTGLTLSCQSGVWKISDAPHGKTVFTTSGTFTIPSGVTAVKATVVGGGGGGAGGYGGPLYVAGGGGGSGAAALKWLTGLTPGYTIAVVVGTAGGGSAGNSGNGGSGTASSISSGTQSISTVTAAGGLGGIVDFNGGTVASASGGDINLYGSVGNFGIYASGKNQSFGGAGAPSIMGPGGPGAPLYVMGDATPGYNYGSGGGGGAVTSSTYSSGARGANGVVIFEW